MDEENLYRLIPDYLLTAIYGTKVGFDNTLGIGCIGYGIHEITSHVGRLHGNVLVHVAESEVCTPLAANNGALIVPAPWANDEHVTAHFPERFQCCR